MNYSSNVDQGNNAAQYREGSVARSIEHQTARIPSDMFLWAAGAAVVGSLALQIVGMRRQSGFLGGIFSPVRAPARAPLAGFIGMWVPSLLLLGIYNKIVKVAGSDRFER